MSASNTTKATKDTQDDVVRELRGRDQVFSFRLGAESIQRKTLECRAADEIERLRIARDKTAEDALHVIKERKAEIERLTKALTLLAHNVECFKKTPIEDFMPSLEAVLVVANLPPHKCEVCNA